MPRLQLKVTGNYMERFADTWRFRVRGNGILFEQTCPHHELNPESISQINETFRNSLRYVKHYGGFSDSSASEEDMMKALDKLSSTDTGIGIRVKDDPVKEFIPFTL